MLGFPLTCHFYKINLKIYKMSSDKSKRYKKQVMPDKTDRQKGPTYKVGFGPHGIDGDPTRSRKRAKPGSPPDIGAGMGEIRKRSKGPTKKRSDTPFAGLHKSQTVSFGERRKKY
jgi:hypothetical protein